jgi:hypothetical protein
MDEQLPNNNVPEESKPSDPNQLSNADLDGVTGGVKKPTADPKAGYLTVTMTDVIISS